MAETTTSLNVKNVSKETFIEWFKTKISDDISETNFDGWELSAYMEEGRGGHFWEGIAIAMVAFFPGIVFEGENDLIWDDHLLHTEFTCDGKEVTLTRSVELPCDCEDLDEDELAEYDEDREWFEAEYDIPYQKKFTVDEIATYWEIMQMTFDVETEWLDVFIAEKCIEKNMTNERYHEISMVVAYVKQ